MRWHHLTHGNQKAAITAGAAATSGERTSHQLMSSAIACMHAGGEITTIEGWATKQPVRQQQIRETTGSIALLHRVHCSATAMLEGS